MTDCDMNKTQTRKDLLSFRFQPVIIILI